MKEITRITTVQITAISDVESEIMIANRAESEKRIAQMMQDKYGADNVVVQVQDFIMDKDGVQL